jgi:small subunit ribosomal protein S21
MLVIKVKENESIERALKRFKNKFQNTQVLKQLRGRKQYVKPSVARRKEMIKAKYIQGLREQEA